jgi:hypothetical protein
MAVNVNSEHGDPRESRLYQVLLEWLESVDLGYEIDVDGAPERYAEFGPEISEFQKMYEWMQQLTAPLRPMRPLLMTVPSPRCRPN